MHFLCKESVVTADKKRSLQRFFETLGEVKDMRRTMREERTRADQLEAEVARLKDALRK